MNISVSGLTKRYGSTLSIDELSFDVPEGSITGLLGPNGAGKSTTIRILTGLSRATAGRATIGGLDVQREHAAIRRRLGYLPELAPAYPEMSVEGFLEFMAGAKGLTGADARAEVARVLGFLDLARWRARLIRNLSKGTRQRVGIAQAFLGRPALAILDEPTAGLDPAQILEVRELLRSMRGECTIFLSTHILPEVEVTCDRAVIINQGRLMASGTIDELRAGPGGDGRETVIATMRGDMSAALSLVARACPGVEISAEALEEGRFVFHAAGPAGEVAWRGKMARALAECGDLLTLESRKPSLEDIYLRAVRQEQERFHAPVPA